MRVYMVRAINKKSQLNQKMAFHVNGSFDQISYSLGSILILAPPLLMAS